MPVEGALRSPSSRFRFHHHRASWRARHASIRGTRSTRALLTPAAGEGRLSGCSSLSGPVVASQSHHYFSLGVYFLKVPEGLRDLARRVGAIDHWDDLAGFEKFPQVDQILLDDLRYPHAAKSLAPLSLTSRGPGARPGKSEAR